MRVLVTGATGFIASHLIPALTDVGHDVVASGHDAERIPAGSTPLVLDLAASDWANLPEVDAVVHLAQANVPVPDEANQLFDVNVASTQRLLDHLRRTGGRHFIFASSGSVYGTSRTPLTEDSPLAARDLYAATKVAAERFVQAYDSCFGTTILRLFVPYGPGQARRMLPRLADRVRAGEPIPLNRGGGPRMNPVYVDDVTNAILRALEGDSGAGVINVAGDDVTDIRSVCELIGEIVGAEPKFEEGETEVSDIVGDNAAFHTFIRDTKLVPLREGIERMVLPRPG